MRSLSPTLLRHVRIDDLLENVAGSVEIAGMVVEEFFVHVEPQLEEIRAAVERADMPLLASLAHRFKGSLAAISATTATTTAGALERAALRREPDAAAREHAALLPQVADVVRTLRAWRESVAKGD